MDFTDTQHNRRKKGDENPKFGLVSTPTNGSHFGEKNATVFLALGTVTTKAEGLETIDAEIRVIHWTVLNIDITRDHPLDLYLADLPKRTWPGDL